MDKKLDAQDVTEYHSKEIPKIPVMGYKYFEPSGSVREAEELEQLLQATQALLSFEKVRKLGSLSQAKWHPQLYKAEVTHQVGSVWSTMGHTIDQKLYLYPEEALYLLETGVMEIFYNDVSMSVQRAYSTLLEPATGLTLNSYRVYSHLQANGYKVLRHIKTNVFTKYEKQIDIPKANIKVKGCCSVNKRSKPLPLVDSECEKVKKPKIEDLTEIFPVQFNGENERTCMEKLRIFNEYSGNGETDLNIQYDIYSKTSEKGNFKKTCLQLPKFRVVIHNGKDEMPEWSEFYHLSQQFQDEVAILHAVVFPEFISFFTITPTGTPSCDES